MPDSAPVNIGREALVHRSSAGLLPNPLHPARHGTQGSDDIAPYVVFTRGTCANNSACVAQALLTAKIILHTLTANVYRRAPFLILIAELRYLTLMGFDLVQIRTTAQAKEDENWRFRDFLKGECDLESEEIDRRVFEITRRVWAGIDCTSCANCCREVRPPFSEEEVDRLARRLGLERLQFIESYLEQTETHSEEPWQTRTLPCPCLKENRCSVCEDRPADCSRYPYLYAPEFVFRTIGMIERTATCPIVFQVMEDLKKSLGFSPKRRH